MKRVIHVMGILSLFLLLFGGCNNLQRELAYMVAMGLICAIMVIKTYFLKPNVKHYGKSFR